MQAWKAAGSAGQRWMNAAREPPGQPEGDGVGDGGLGVGGAGVGGAGVGGGGRVAGITGCASMSLKTSAQEVSGCWISSMVKPPME